MKKKRIFLGLFILSLAVFLLEKEGVLRPLKGQIDFLLNPGKAAFYSLTKKPTLFFESLSVKREKVEKMEKVKRELAACTFKINNLEKENEDLRRLLQAPLPKNWAFLPAKVLGKKRYLAIDKGDRDGVFSGMIAVFENFLVGKVVKTNSFSSQVALPFDSEKKIPAKTEKGARGLIEGRAGSRIFLSKVLQKETLEVGDLVVTTGEGDWLPDLLIGKVKITAKETKEPFQEVEIDPFLDYGSLTTVFLVKQ